MKLTRQIGSFQAKSDSGQLYTVIELQEYDSVLISTGTIVETEGLKKWQTSTGSLLKQIDSETYQIATTNEIVRKI
jgi:hypothetical protein